MKQEIKFLGHVINQNGKHTESTKIEAIKNFQRSICIKKFWLFLRITNYYRRFIKNYTDFSKILECLCGSNMKKLFWTDDCEEAFQFLKEQLIKSPVLIFSDFTNEFILDTDASFDYIGPVLAQLDENRNKRVIAYGSKSMNKHELTYCITRKKLLVIFYFTHHFKHYL